MTNNAGDSQRKSGYWDSRSTSLYYQAVYQMVCVIGNNARSIIDIGSSKTDFLNWFDWIPEKTQLDKGFGESSPPLGIDRIDADFFHWEPSKKYDVVLCMQVLEHIEDAEGFCTRLKNLGDRLLISVPYKWSGKHPAHVQDPVDREKVARWMKLKPNRHIIVQEPFGPKRYVAYYDMLGGPDTEIQWKDARELINARAALKSPSRE